MGAKVDTVMMTTVHISAAGTLCRLNFSIVSAEEDQVKGWEGKNLWDGAQILAII